jgi:hypothetical protein
MTADYLEGVDEIFTAANQAWLTEAQNILGEVPPLFWQGVQEPDVPNNSKYWARVTRKTLTDDQITAGTNINGKQRHEINGILLLEIAVPADDGEVKKGSQLANALKQAFKGATTPLCVRFAAARVDEIGGTSRGYQYNIVIEYEHQYIS